MKGKFPNGLKAAMEAKGIGPSELARLVGTSKQNIQRWADAERRLVEEWAEKLAPHLGVKPQELIFSPSRRKLVDSFDPDAPDPPEDDDRMVEGEFHRNVGDLPTDAILQVDVSPGMGGGGFTLVDSARADDGNFYAVEGVRDWLRLPDELVRGQFRVPSKRVRAFTADGDSMEPTIRDGDLVFVDICHTTPSPPGIYALNDAFGGVILKRLEVVSGLDPEVRVLVKSDNPLHSTKEHSIEEIVIRGRYLGRLTTRFD